MESVVEFLKKDRAETVRVAVVGDAMVDEYYNVKVTRISPEFPNQIMHSPDWKPATQVPGGSANVCKQMERFNVKCFLVSFVDRLAKHVFESEHFDIGYCIDVTEHGGHVPTKRRFYDGDYPLPRWDIESGLYGLSIDEFTKFIDILFVSFVKLIEEQNVNVVILSDYGKGLFSGDLSERIIKFCNDRDIETIVDPKNLNKWEKCSIIKPNTFEAIGNDPKRLLDYVGCKTAVVTRAGEPPLYCSRHGDKELLLTRRPTVRSVVGAGDCFCAFLAMAVARGMNHVDAIEVAWNASSRYVENKYNKSLSPHELSMWNDPVISKIVSVEEVSILKDNSLVWTNGCFDVVHLKHLELLRFCKGQGGHVVVGVNSDESVRRLKGNGRPINGLRERMLFLAMLDSVDFVVSFDEDTPFECVKKLKPDIVVKGGDYVGKYVAGSEFSEVRYFPLGEGFSTSSTIDRIRNAN